MARHAGRKCTVQPELRTRYISIRPAVTRAVFIFLRVSFLSFFFPFFSPNERLLVRTIVFYTPTSPSHLTPFILTFYDKRGNYRYHAFPPSQTRVSVNYFFTVNQPFNFPIILRTKNNSRPCKRVSCRFGKLSRDVFYTSRARVTAHPRPVAPRTDDKRCIRVSPRENVCS